MSTENMLKLETFFNSRRFKKYLASRGVKIYRHFGKLPEDYQPTLADAAMAQLESQGAKKVKEDGIVIGVEGAVYVDGNSIGISKLAFGKSSLDLTVSMWLEDVGTVGFNPSDLRREYDELFGTGWFNSVFTGKVTPSLMHTNYSRDNLQR